MAKEFKYYLEMTVTTVNPKKSAFKGYEASIKIVTYENPLNKEDEELIGALTNHFQPMFKQPIFNILIKNYSLV